MQKKKIRFLFPYCVVQLSPASVLQALSAPWEGAQRWLQAAFEFSSGLKVGEYLISPSTQLQVNRRLLYVMLNRITLQTQFGNNYICFAPVSIVF